MGKPERQLIDPTDLAAFLNEMSAEIDGLKERARTESAASDSGRSTGMFLLGEISRGEHIINGLAAFIIARTGETVIPATHTGT